VSFNSVAYALFLPAVVLAYWASPRRARLPLLLVASYVFYGAWDVRFLALLGFTTVVDYNVARALERVTGTSARRWVLAVSVGVNLGVLGYFKYAGFFVEQFEDLLSQVGLDPATPVLQVVLPVGISFYTFQSIGYTVDVFRRRIPACHDPVRFATFVAFFPQLVAGPISRAQHLLPQLDPDRHPPRLRQVWSAFGLLLVGLVKKVVLADSLAPMVNRAFAEPGRQGSVALAAAAVGFTLQIYGDFSGYTDLARGSSRLFGVELVHNFRQPFLSRSITEFWQRWHISLSTWLRDYLYVPLGGNRDGPGRTYVNLVTTMVLGGLWHGAAWGFVAWGALHGTYLAVERALHRDTRRGPEVPRAGEVPAILFTFGLVVVAFVFFRAGTVRGALDVLAGIVAWRGPAPRAGELALLGGVATAVLAIDLVERTGRAPRLWSLAHPVRSGALAGVATAALLVFAGGTPVPFIYFQF
jgi:D-alanyl-lipoteichoic acid acyltransferase DltB (MBOAT superfamily)